MWHKFSVDLEHLMPFFIVAMVHSILIDFHTIAILIIFDWVIVGIVFDEIPIMVVLFHLPFFFDIVHLHRFTCLIFYNIFLRPYLCVVLMMAVLKIEFPLLESLIEGGLELGSRGWKRHFSLIFLDLDQLLMRNVIFHRVIDD